MKTIYRVLTACLLTGSWLLHVAALPAGAAQTSDDPLRATIEAYFVRRCAAYRTNSPTLEMAEIADLKDSRTIAWLGQEQHIRAVQNAIQTAFPASLADCRFTLTYQEQHSGSGVATVRLAARQELVYEKRPEKPALVANVLHVITLKQGGSGWLILEDRYSDDFTRLLQAISPTRALENIRQHQANEGAGGAMPGAVQPAGAGRLQAYGRAAAVAYAMQHYDRLGAPGAAPAAVTGAAGWNRSWNPAYQQYPNDCANFVSQALFEGVEHTASDANLLYPDYAHTTEGWYYKFAPQADGSLPWVLVGDLYEFLTENDFNYTQFGPDTVQRGPAGRNSEVCALHPGDLVFTYANDGKLGWAHVVMVTEVDAGACSSGRIYVAAHSDDAVQRPLSDYSGYLWYPVTITGYFAK